MQEPKLYVNMINDLGDDYLIGNPDGEPYAVRIFGRGYIPCSVLVYADSEEDAKERVLRAYKDLSAISRSDSYAKKRAVKLLDELEKGILNIESEKFDKRYISKIPWAMNDNL